MPHANQSQVSTACYRTNGKKTPFIISAALIVVGIILIIFCVPLWAWLAIAGALLILLGIFLLLK